MNWHTLVSQISYTDLLQLNDVTITGIEIDSRKVKEGNVFVCLAGEHVNGHHYIHQAIDNGAVVIVTEEKIEPIEGVVTLYTPSTVRSLAEISCAYYENPSQHMQVIGVTGTNGKTSVTHFLNQLYRENGIKTGVIGTIHTDIDGVVTPSENTTPFAHDLQRTLHEMKKQHVRYVFMEVSSHALSMGRVKGCRFTQGVFTNLSQDHLDYHDTMDDYRQAKGRLFAQLGNTFDKTAVLNRDDDTYSYLESLTGASVLSYGIEKEAHLMARDIKMDDGLSFTVTYQEKTYSVHTALVGRFHVYNLLAVIGVCLADGWAMEDIINGVNRLTPVKGRMENVETGEGSTVIIDFAHTPDALENALQSLTKQEGSKVYTLVGCGGNRDATKRPLMARVAEVYSDEVFLTSDNPRLEDPKRILMDMEAGMKGLDYHVIIDRKEAIKQAVKQLKKGDVLLIAGKGHEDYQIIGTEKTPFSDRQVVQEALAEKHNLSLTRRLH